MRDEYLSQRNAIPKTSDADTTATRRISGADYTEKMKARYKQFAQRATVSKTEEVSVMTPIPKTEEVSVMTPIPKTEEVSAVTSTESSPLLSKLFLLMLQAQRVLKRTPMAVVAVVVGLVTLFVHGYRLNVAPDVFSDEGSYLLVSTNVARGLGLTVDHSPFFYHPPAYFLIEATYIKLMGLTNTAPITALLSVRYINIFFSAITASFLLLLGRKLHSYKAGWIMVALFLMDPYVQRINRRNMLETLSMLFLLLGFYIFFTHRKYLMKWQWLGSGIAFGLATLTKEAIFFPLFTLLGIVAWTRRTQLIDAIRVVAIAWLLYLAYPLSEIAVGEGSNYFAFKLTQLGLVVGSITGHGLDATSQKTLSPGNLWLLLGQYATSYFLVALAGIFTIILFLRFRHLMAARYLCAWSFFSFIFGIILGRESDQYFYFLILPNAIILNGYMLAILFESVQYRRWWHFVLPLFVCLLFIYNSGIWMTKYVYGSDDGYAKITAYLNTHIPPGTTIDISDDVGYYLLSPTYNIRLDRDKELIIGQHEYYFIMSSKDRWGGYNETTPRFYDWVVQNSQPLVVVQEDSFWTIGLYYMKMPQATSPPAPPSTPSVTMDRFYLGTFYDIPTSLKTNISLMNIRQQQWNISGNFGGTSENGAFTGTINAARQIQFIVTNSTRQATSSFQGVIQQDGSIAGTYCTLKASTGNCSDYGLWSVSPGGAGLVGSSYSTQRLAQPAINFYKIALTGRRSAQLE